MGLQVFTVTGPTNVNTGASNIRLEHTPLFVNAPLCTMVPTRSINTATGRIFFSYLLHNNFCAGIECMFLRVALTRLPHR